MTFKEFGVGVTFTPVVMSEGPYHLKIETEVSELTDAGAVVLSGISIPRSRSARRTRRGMPSVERCHGRLLSDDTRKNIDGFPGLKDVPMLGTLFAARVHQARDRLVVLVTPYMVRPTDRKQLRAPRRVCAGFRSQGNLLGHMNRVYAGRPTTSRWRPQRRHRFIVE